MVCDYAKSKGKRKQAECFLAIAGTLFAISIFCGVGFIIAGLTVFPRLKELQDTFHPRNNLVVHMAVEPFSINVLPHVQTLDGLRSL